MSDSKKMSRREVVAASGAVLLPVGMACPGMAQTPPQQPPQGAQGGAGAPAPGRAANAPIPVDRTPLFQPEGANKPMGVGKGIYPGRVAWVHNPEVATWDGKTGEWWDDANTNEAIVERMMSRSLQGLTGQKTDKKAWDALFRHFNTTRNNSDAGYKPGEKISIKMNSNRDQHPEEGWTHPAVTKKGMASPHVVNALIRQLINVAGVPGEDITLYDVADNRYIGDPIYKRILANPSPAFRDVKFLVNTKKAGNGRIPPIPDKTDPLRWSDPELAKTINPIVCVPTLVAEAKYRINMCVWRAHDIAAVTLCAKNNFGSIYWPQLDYWGPRPLHAGWIQRTRPMGSYSVWADITAHRQLGLKNMLYIIDGLYAAQASELDVAPWVSFGDQWPASLLMSQDPVAIDSVAVDFLRTEPTQIHVRGSADNYLHEAALIEDPPSKTRYMPSGERVSSLGVHEHWNNPVERKYSRNLGRKEGIELLQLKG
jgi:uncharacterized protein (DUF362 family)